MKDARLSLLFLAALLAECAIPGMAQARLERIIVAPDSHGFVTAESKRSFHPWGFNYGNHGRLMEDFWNDDWKTFADDFGKMKALGANVVRVHLQYGKFMSGPNQPNLKEFEQLSRMLRLAEKTGLYLDITGLACYRPGDTPKWYDAMNERERWTAQSNFWSAVAATCAKSPAVFCYDLINEPIVPGSKREPGAWRSGKLFGDYDFVQFITLDPAGHKRKDIAVDWIRTMTAAIRAHDTNALITVGLLPWTPQWGFLSGFVPEKIAPDLDFIAVHIYPDSKNPNEAMECLRQCAVGKPVVIEETFPLSCNAAEEEKFLRESKQFACGWLGHYDGCSLKDFDRLERAGKLTLSQAIYREWERMFVKLKPQFAPEK
jgi:Cellulase (glycosyl hydrolase family 5)